ncbi:hypothetical protein DL766_003218 [Monosporascus sp. MC13-8B]|nr:hypothetical protein DL763_004646 [Monosporascus cannonballus]RYP33946.1 hypothetical protein DL766_003218 [Monosporascus sp. MC13-8B]
MHTVFGISTGFALLQWATLGTCAVLLSGGTIVAFDTETELPQVIRNGPLLIEDDKITSIFDSEPSDLPADTEIIDCKRKIITPGFIDTHRHGWQTVSKTLGSNTTLATYFDRYGEYAAGSSFTADDVYISQLAGLYEALNAGVTTTLDHAHHTWSRETSQAGLQASVDSGARVFWAYTFHDVANYTFAEQFDDWRDLFSNTESDTTTVAIAYDAWTSNPATDETKEIVNLTQENNVSVMTAHGLGGPWCFGNLPEAFQTAGILNSSTPIVISHASFLTAEGAQLLRSTNQYISITPESEMHYGHGHPTSYLIQDQAALGIDTHFTFSSDVLTQARIWLQSVRARLYATATRHWKVPANNPMSVNQAFRLATRSGGLALRRPDLGIIAPGAKADVVVWDDRSPALLGWSDPIAAVILHASVADIEHVIVNGVFKKREGKLVVNDYAEIQDRFLASAKRIQDIWKSKPLPALEGAFQSDYSYYRVEPDPQLQPRRLTHGTRASGRRAVGAVDAPGAADAAAPFNWNTQVTDAEDAIASLSRRTQFTIAAIVLGTICMLLVWRYLRRNRTDLEPLPPLANQDEAIKILQRNCTKQVEEARSQLEKSLSRRVEALEKQFQNALSEQSKAIEENFRKGLNKRVEALEARMKLDQKAIEGAHGTLRQGMETLEECIRSIDSKQLDLEATLIVQRGLNHRLEKVEGTLQTTDGKTRALSQRVEAIDDSSRVLDSRSKSISQRLEAVEDTVGSMDGQAALLSHDVSRGSLAVEKLQKQVKLLPDAEKFKGLSRAWDARFKKMEAKLEQCHLKLEETLEERAETPSLTVSPMESQEIQPTGVFENRRHSYSPYDDFISMIPTPPSVRSMSSSSHTRTYSTTSSSPTASMPMTPERKRIDMAGFREMTFSSRQKLLPRSSSSSFTSSK